MSPTKEKFLSGLPSLIRGSSSKGSVGTPQADTFKSSTQELHSAIKSLKLQIQKKREDLAARNASMTSAGSGSPNARPTTGRSSKELEQEELEQAVKSMRGIVTAWRKYPESTSWLWQEVALRGVASGVRCQLTLKAVTKLRADADQLKSKADELISENISKIEYLVQSGMRALDDAEEVVRGTNVVVQELLPDLAWQQVKGTVDQAALSFGRVA